MDRRVRVLFVDGDDDPTTVSPRDLSDAGGFEVEAVGNVAAAERDLTAYDCVVSNYALAEGDGVDVAAELRDSHPSLPVVVYTAVGDEAAARDALRAGAADYVVSGETDEGAGAESGGEAAVLARRVEAAVAEAARAADREETAAQLETLTRVLTHDVRNDLSVVVGWADVLRDSVTEDGEAALQRVLDSGRHTLELTDVARDAVETIVGGTDELGPTDLREVLRGEVRARRETYPEASVELGDVPACRVVANSLLGAVFRTLLNEALAHRRGDDPSVRVSAERVGETVHVRVTDETGTADPRRETAFDDAELDSPDPNIGVFLVETLVDAYGGDVRVEDGGATFVVELRAAD